MVYRLPVDEAARMLADVDADDLVAVVLDADAPWWRRRLSAAGLHRRLPARHAEPLFELLVNGTGEFEVTEVLAEVLGTTPGPVAEPLLSWLKLRSDLRYESRPALHLLGARVAIGDPEVVRPLVRVAAEDHWRFRDGANDLLDELGAATVLTALDASSPDELMDPSRWPEDDDVRLAGVRMLRLADDDPTPALADPSRMVARAAYEALAERAHLPGGPVDRMAAGPGPGRLWALAVLSAQGQDITALPAAVAASRVELPTVPADVRAAIVRHWAPGRRRTDPRWLVEMAFVEPAVVDVDDQLRRAAAALDAAGSCPGQAVPAGELFDQGEGTYHRIPTTAGPVDVSTLGPFFRTDDGRSAAALRLAGFRHVNDRLAGTLVAGLCVYFFGSTDPLPVGDLLFYWQD